MWRIHILAQIEISLQLRTPEPQSQLGVIILPNLLKILHLAESSEWKIDDCPRLGKTCLWEIQTSQTFLYGRFKILVVHTKINIAIQAQ